MEDHKNPVEEAIDALMIEVKAILVDVEAHVGWDSWSERHTLSVIGSLLAALSDTAPYEGECPSLDSAIIELGRIKRLHGTIFAAVVCSLVINRVKAIQTIERDRRNQYR